MKYFALLQWLYVAIVMLMLTVVALLRRRRRQKRAAVFQRRLERLNQQIDSLHLQGVVNKHLLNQALAEHRRRPSPMHRRLRHLLFISPKQLHLYQRLLNYLPQP